MDGTACGEVCMLNITKETQIYLACGATDMRKSINGLCAIVQGNFELDPFQEAGKRTFQMARIWRKSDINTKL